ncbi:MAG TPA: hypothetical protein VGM79_13600 [Streptosporangiaceae bacterium]|jgi:hypothetical protein
MAGAGQFGVLAPGNAAGCQLIPASQAIADPAIAAPGDRRDGVALLTEALADTHETGRSGNSPGSSSARSAPRATHADRPGRPLAVARDIRPAIMQAELAADDVLFDKLHWSQPDTARRDTWQPAGGVLPNQQHAVLGSQASRRPGIVAPGHAACWAGELAGV